MKPADPAVAIKVIPDGLDSGWCDLLIDPHTAVVERRAAQLLGPTGAPAGSSRAGTHPRTTAAHRPQRSPLTMVLELDTGDGLGCRLRSGSVPCEEVIRELGWDSWTADITSSSVLSAPRKSSTQCTGQEAVE